METRTPLFDLAPQQFGQWLTEQGAPAYRAAQIRQWLFRRRVARWREMTDVPKTLRADLDATFSIWSSRVVDQQRAGDGTCKLLLELADASHIECVLIGGRRGRSVCISTQVGCAMGCVFCATGLEGVRRNLTSGEMVEQLLHLQRCLPMTERISRIVVMGMGEPLANLEALVAALDAVRRPDALGISTRRITISSVGLPRGIDRLARHRPCYPLAISLHAPNDALRNQLVPINRKIGLARIMQAADRYFAASGRKLTFEYVVLRGINDRAEHAHELVQLLRHRTALVNLIPYNAVAGLDYRTPRPAVLREFRRILEAGGLNVRQRQRKGDRIGAACGQLRQRQKRRFD